MQRPAQIGERENQFLWGMVRTLGWQFDGDRGDIHDVLSLIWGAVLRAFGIASVRLVDEAHIAVPGEIGARHVLLHQSPWEITESSLVTARESLNAWTALAFHLLDDVFEWDRRAALTRPDLAMVRRQKYPIWADRIIRYLRNPTDATVTRRTFPRWVYFSSQDRGITVVRLSITRVSSLRAILRPFVPEGANGEESYALFANGIPNAIPYKLIKRARKILLLTDEKCSGAIMLPLDSHCLFIGDRTIVALRGECGRDRFEEEREKMIARRSRENRVFMAEATIEWRTPLRADDLEDLCLDLIKREPGVFRAKAVGTMNDRDGGRDVLIDWKVPIAHAVRNDSVGSHDAMAQEGKRTRVIRVIAQVKSRSRTVGKRDVQDIRDTLEHHQAEGFLLIAHPRISAALVDHLDKLGKTKVYTSWWETRDIEERLRRHPDIAKRYPRLVALQATS